MTRTLLFSTAAVIGSLLLGACAPTTFTQTQLVTYRCDNNVGLQAFYGNAGRVTLTLRNRMLTLPVAVSADGVRYSDGVTTWWTRGQQGNLEENGVLTAANCQDVESASPLPVPVQDVTLTAADAQRTTFIQVGSHITVRLDSNVTTGYRYEVQSPFDLTAVRQTASAQESVSTGMVGTPGVQTFDFEAVQSGTDVITVIKRSPSGDIVETLAFPVSVD